MRAGETEEYAIAMVGEEILEWMAMHLFSELSLAARNGGMTADERSSLAENFGVSEDLLLRYERASSAYATLARPSGLDEACERALRERRKRRLGREEFKKFYGTTPEDEITDEYFEASTAIRAALATSTSTLLGK